MAEPTTREGAGATEPAVESNGVAAAALETTSRRSALRFAAAAAAAGAAAPLLLGHGTARAADGDPITVGQTTFGSDPGNDTYLIHDNFNRFIVKDLNSPTPPDGTVGKIAMLQGWGPTGGKGVFGVGPGGGVGVVGHSDTGTGVYGHSASGPAVYAAGGGIVGLASHFTHNGLAPATASPAGRIVRDSVGAFWVGGATATHPGAGAGWRRMNSFIPISPVRAWDSREASGNVAGGTTGAMSNGALRTLTINGLAAVPTAASGVACVFTAVNPSGQGRITAWPTGTTEPSTSTGNWQAGAAVTNFYPNVGLGTGGDQGKLSVRVTTSGTVDLVLDITGYYV